MTNNCLYYDHILGKTIPCILVPNQLYTINHRKYVNINFDASQFTNYNTNIHELSRYSLMTMRLIDLYPNTNSDQLAYAQACIPNLIANSSTFEFDELTRCKALVEMALNASTLTSDTFYKLADFLSYEVLFLYLQANEKHFMLTIATIHLTTGNVAAVIAANGGITTIIPFLQACLTLFSSYAYTENIYYIQNIMNLANTNVTFPLTINVPLLQGNLQFLKDNNYI